MNQPPDAEKGDLVLAPGMYAYIQSETNGGVKTYVGPTVPSMQAQDRPVQFDSERKTFNPVHSQEDAVMANIVAGEGDYVILENPASDNSHPSDATGNTFPERGLKMGSRIVIAGPTSFALWPGQCAKTLRGHHLSSNEFLIVRVYNEKEARNNWTEGTVTIKKPDGEEPHGEEPHGEEPHGEEPHGEEPHGEEPHGEETEPLDHPRPVKQIAEQESLSAINPKELKRGQRIIVRGDQVSFYIPPTGVEVIEECDRYVREAVTLERLEYCILVDENGDKRYERGPSVIFPTPTEHFITKDSARKFRAIELTTRSGLHIKVIHDYEDKGQKYKAGQEIFITGEEQAIYFPRVEHSIIKYGTRDQHFAVAIPRGEGRYVMDRDNGVIETKKGPDMLLPDPRTKVVVRRILSEKEVKLWYPDNVEAVQYNRDLAETLAAANLEMSGPASANAGEDYAMREGMVSERMYSSARATRGQRSKKLAAKVTKGLHGDEFERGEKFSQPRTVTLDTKYEGVAAISPFVGYAVMTTTKDGKREVHQGPCTILLEYDETLEVLSISTGKPKNTEDLKRTVYLRIRNNKVSDIVRVETRDHVSVDIKISLLVNFEGDDPELWFQAENYVKLLCDHVRSVLKGSVQRITIEDFYASHVAVVRDAILGASVESEDGRSRPGMSFEENGMVVRDVEVLDFDIKDREVFGLLSGAQLEAVRSNIEIEQAQKQLNRDLRQEEINQKTAEARAGTTLHKLTLDTKIVTQTLEANLAKFEAASKEAEQEKTANNSVEEADNVEHEWKQRREREIQEQKNNIDTQKQELFLKRLQAEVDSAVKRFEAGKGGLSEALLALNRDDVMIKVAKAMSVQSLIGGKSFVEVVQKVFEGIPPLSDIATRIAMHHNNQGDPE